MTGASSSRPPPCRRGRRAPGSRSRRIAGAGSAAGPGRTARPSTRSRWARALPTRPIGPHSLPSLASEWRGYTFTVWGSTFHEGADHLSEAGWLDEMDRDLEGAQEDPELGDGLYHGPSRGHTDEEHARLIGMPRGYGYGASMGAWVLDYVAALGGRPGPIPALGRAVPLPRLRRRPHPPRRRGDRGPRTTRCSGPAS